MTGVGILTHHLVLGWRPGPRTATGGPTRQTTGRCSVCEWTGHSRQAPSRGGKADVRRQFAEGHAELPKAPR